MGNIYKKIIAFIAVLTVVISLMTVPLVIYATTDEAGTIAGTGLIWSYTAADKTLVISYSGNGVSAIPAIPYYSKHPFFNKMFRTLRVEEGVTDIGDYFLYNHTYLNNVVIEGSVANIGKSAFEGCSALETVSLDDVGTIKTYAFTNCSNLKTITAGDITLLETSVFSYTKNLESFTAGDIGTISKEVFYGQTKLNTITVDSIENIGLNAFKGTPVHSSYPSEKIVEISKTASDSVFVKYNDYTKEVRIYGTGFMQDFAGADQYQSEAAGLLTTRGPSGGYPFTSIVIEEGVKNIGDNALWGAWNQTVNIPLSVESIGKSSMNGVKDVTGMQGVKIIKESAFYKSDFQLYTMPETLPELETIEDSAFRESKITTLNAPKLKTVGKSAFYRSNINTLNAPQLETVGESAFEASQLKTLEVENLADVGSRAFYNLSQLDITTTQDIANIGLSAFKGTKYENMYISKLIIEIGKVNLSDVVVSINEKTGEAIVSGNGEMRDLGSYWEDNIHTKAQNKGYPLKSVIIEDGVESIGNATFHNAVNLESIVIPSSITKMGTTTFRNTQKLKTIYNHSEINQNVGSNSFSDAGSSITDKTAYIYSANTNFETQVRDAGYTIVYLDSYTTTTSTLEEWLDAGKTMDEWFSEGNTIEEYIGTGGTSEQWTELFTRYPSYLLGQFNYNPISAWTGFGGTGGLWGSVGGTEGSWVANGGTEENFLEGEEPPIEPPVEGDVRVFVDDIEVMFPDVQPKVSSEKILVPVRFVMTELGADVYWDEVENIAIIRKTEKDGKLIEIVMKPYSSVMTVNGKEYQVDAQIELVEPGRLVLPGSELVKAYQDIFYKQEVPVPSVYEGYYYSEEVAGVEGKFEDIPTIPEFTPNLNIVEITEQKEIEISEQIKELEDSNIIFSSDTTMFKVTIPIKILAHQLSNADVVVADNYFIENKCSMGMIKIVKVDITEKNSWVLEDIDNNFYNKKVNEKVYGIKLNGIKGIAGTFDSITNTIKNGEKLLLDIQMKIAAQKVYKVEDIAGLEFTVDFY